MTKEQLEFALDECLSKAREIQNLLDECREHIGEFDEHDILSCIDDAEDLADRLESSIKF